MIWLMGNKGMLGTELTLLLKKNKLPFVGTDREVDITDYNALKKFCENKSINWIINCVAYTAVNEAEENIELCRRINTFGAGNIAILAKYINARLIHISTDYVFDGKKVAGQETLHPYREDDETNPISVYGLSKRDGEITVLENNPASYIIRTSWLYGKYGNNFIRTMLKLMNERDVIKVINDKRGSPTWTYDLAFVIIDLIRQTDEGSAIPYGIYHYSNEGNISWFDLAMEIYIKGRGFGLLTKNCDVIPCNSDDFPYNIKRPAYSILDKTKIKSTLKINIPLWDESFQKYLINNEVVL